MTLADYIKNYAYKGYKLVYTGKTVNKHTGLVHRGWMVLTPTKVYCSAIIIVGN